MSQLKETCKRLGFSLKKEYEEEEYANALMSYIVNRAAGFNKEKYNAIAMDIVPLKDARTFLTFMTINILTKYLGVKGIVPQEMKKFGDDNELIIFDNLHRVKKEDDNIREIRFVGDASKSEGYVSVLHGLHYEELLEIAKLLYDYREES